MSWAEEEFGGAVLGDARLTKRLVRLVDDLSSSPTKSIPVACAGPAEVKAAYRLLDNAGLDWRAVLGAHGVPTAARMAQEARVLCIQDTTELDFTSQPGIAGLGRLTYDRQHGMYVHPTLAVSEGGVALGVLDAWMWSRQPRGEADVLESLRWTEGYGRVAELAASLPGVRLVYLGDREADLRGLVDLAAESGHAADYLVRAKHDRVLEDGGKLRAEVERQVPLGKKPVEWLLLTNEAVATLDEACLRVAWYRKRWLVEIFFRILKSGCKVEALQLATVDRLERALALYLVIAWRILHLVTLGRDCPDLPCDVAFSAEEWRAAWLVAKRQPPPDAPPPLGEMVRIVAGFGGFLGRKGDGHPGPKALWEGLLKLMAYVEAFQATREVYGKG